MSRCNLFRRINLLYFARRRRRARKYITLINYYGNYHPTEAMLKARDYFEFAFHGH